MRHNTIISPLSWFCLCPTWRCPPSGFHPGPAHTERAAPAPRAVSSRGRARSAAPWSPPERCRTETGSRWRSDRDRISSKVGFLRPYRWNKNCTYFVIFAIWQKELIKCSDIIYIHNEQYNLSISYYVWGWEDLKHILKKPFKAAFIRAKYNENSNTKKYCYTFKITVF